MSDPVLLGDAVLSALRVARDAAEANRETARVAYVHAVECAHAANEAVNAVYREAGICEGCAAPSGRCGPALWAQQRKCCPDCTHVAPVVVGA